MDMRVLVRTSSKSQTSEDCLRLYNSVLGQDDVENENLRDNAPEVLDALHEIAQGVSSLTRDSAAVGNSDDNKVCDGVFIRIVCASEYKARDPMFHTDKAPLRAYVTLCGVGTEIMTRPCSPLEYATLRSLGTINDDDTSSRTLRQANELEFIVMKGDYYKHSSKNDRSSGSGQSSSPSWMAANFWWKRASACVHRSPPGTGGRRIIFSLDLADGDDDREWYEVNKKREWRSGMTQRKSRLVA